MVTPPLPAPGDTVVLALTYDSHHEVLVTGCDGEVVTVRAPRLGEGDAPSVDDELTLRWTTLRGRHEAWVQLVAVSSSGRQHWDLLPFGEIASWQERRYVRGGGGEPIEITRSTIHSCLLTGTVVDLAERSVRAKLTFPAPHADPDDPDRLPVASLHVGEGVAVSLRIGARSMGIPGRVSRVCDVPAFDPTARVVDAVILLDVTDRQADTVRRYLFESQRQARTKHR